MNRIALRTAVLFGVLALVGSSRTAHAVTFDFSYSGPGVTASGTFDTTPISTAGEYLITGLTGTRNGNAIILIPGNADGSAAHNGVFTYNNVLTSPGTPSLDKFGILFQTSDGIFNVYSGPLQEANNQGTVINLTSFTVTPSTSCVPERGSVALLVGMASVGAGVLRRRRQ